MKCIGRTKSLNRCKNQKPKAEYFIYRIKSPSQQSLITSGSARVVVPDNAMLTNGEITISPHSSFYTKVRLPKLEELSSYMETGGYELELVVYNQYGYKFKHSEKRLFDNETIKQGYRFWFRLVSEKIDPS